MSTEPEEPRPEGEKWRAPVSRCARQVMLAVRARSVEGLARSARSILHLLSRCGPSGFNAATRIAACFSRSGVNSAGAVMRAQQFKSRIRAGLLVGHVVRHAVDDQRL